MNRESLLAQFEMLLPLAAAWATEEEQKIVREGVALSAEEIGDARAIAVTEPDRVRLLRTETIPRPTQPQLKAACDARINFGARDFYSIGLVGRSITHCARARARRAVRKTGRNSSFPAPVPFECLTVGYSAAPLELKAIAVTARVCAE
jgi:hypothetical protein